MKAPSVLHTRLQEKEFPGTRRKCISDSDARFIDRFGGGSVLKAERKLEYQQWTAECITGVARHCDRAARGGGDFSEPMDDCEVEGRVT